MPACRQQESWRSAVFRAGGSAGNPQPLLNLHSLNPKVLPHPQKPLKSRKPPQTQAVVSEELEALRKELATSKAVGNAEDVRSQDCIGFMVKRFRVLGAVQNRLSCRGMPSRISAALQISTLEGEIGLRSGHSSRQQL